VKPVDPIGRREKNLERVALRHGLTFYLDGHYIVKTNGWEGELREATDEEIQMWSILCPEDPDHLVASVEEVRACWNERNGPFTINARDYHSLKGCGRDFEPENRKEYLVQGLIGTYTGKTVYVSKAIPIGFFYEGDRIPALHWYPARGSFDPEPDLPAEVELQVWNTLYPFKLSG
jgi:hypothetical protein